MTTPMSHPEEAWNLYYTIRASVSNTLDQTDLALESAAHLEDASGERWTLNYRRAVICVELLALDVTLLASKWVDTQVRMGTMPEDLKMRVQDEFQVSQAIERLAKRLTEFLASFFPQV